MKFRRTRLAATTLAVAVSAVGGPALAANATTGPHNTYRYTYKSSVSGWASSQTWIQYQTSRTYDEEQIRHTRKTTGAGSDYTFYKWDRNGKWVAHLTGASWSSKLVVVYENKWTHN